jgi:hypothetical protein
VLAVRNRHSSKCSPLAIAADRSDRVPQPYSPTPFAEAHAAAGHARFPRENDGSASAIAGIRVDATGDVTVRSLGDDGTSLTLRRSRCVFDVVYPIREPRATGDVRGGMVTQELAVSNAPACWAHPLQLALDVLDTGVGAITEPPRLVGDTIAVALPVPWKLHQRPVSLNQLELHYDQSAATPELLWSHEHRATVFFGPVDGAVLQEWGAAGETFVYTSGDFFQRFPPVKCGECAPPSVYRPRHLDAASAAKRERTPAGQRDRALHVALAMLQTSSTVAGEAGTVLPRCSSDGATVTEVERHHLREIQHCGGRC